LYVIDDEAVREARRRRSNTRERKSSRWCDDGLERKGRRRREWRWRTEAQIGKERAKQREGVRT
jgi:hypothetical protein